MKLTDRVEYDSSLEVHHVDLFLHRRRSNHGSVAVAVGELTIRCGGSGGCLVAVVLGRSDFSVGGGVFLLAPLDESSAEVVCEEGKHQTSQEDCRRRSFVLELTQTLVAKHELGMGEQVNESGGQDDSGSELLQYGKEDIVLRDNVEPRGDNGQEHAESAGGEDHKQQSNPERHVVFATGGIAGLLSLGRTRTSNTVPSTG